MLLLNSFKYILFNNNIYMNYFAPGNFITIKESIKPAMIISNINNYDLLASLYEYKGDYLCVNINNAVIINLSCEEELSILANFGEWFYDQHKLLFQEKIINFCMNNLT